jgi:hypothetical protein
MPPSTTKPALRAALLAAFTALACSGGADESDSGAGDGASGSNSGDGASSSSGGTRATTSNTANASNGSGDGTTSAAGGAGGAGSDSDLFACNATPSCDPYRCSGGFCFSTSDETRACVADYADGTTPGLLLFETSLDPYNVATHSLVVLLGDGRAVRASRDRCAEKDDWGNPPVCDEPWRTLPQELCDIVPENCPSNAECELPWYENCEPLDSEFTCADLDEVLDRAGEGGAAGVAN